jgi:hypothetical protein
VDGADEVGRQPGARTRRPARPRCSHACCS